MVYASKKHYSTKRGQQLHNWRSNFHARKSRWAAKKRVGSVWLAPKSGIVIPDRTFTRLRWTKLEDRTGGGTNRDLVTYRGNAPVRPAVTDVTDNTQPYGFRQIDLFYLNVRCWSSSIRVDIVNTGVEPCTFFVLPSAIIPYSTTDKNILDQPYCKYKVAANVAGAATKITIFHKMTTAKMAGLSKFQIKSDPNFYSSTVSQPFNIWYWNIGCISPVGTVAVAYTYTTTITYSLEFFERYILPPSDQTLAPDVGGTTGPVRPLDPLPLWH